MQNTWIFVKKKKKPTPNLSNASFLLKSSNATIFL